MGLRICTANNFPGDADGAGPGTPALEALCNPAPSSQVRGLRSGAVRQGRIPRSVQARLRTQSCPAPGSDLCSCPDCREVDEAQVTRGLLTKVSRPTPVGAGRGVLTERGSRGRGRALGGGQA